MTHFLLVIIAVETFAMNAISNVSTQQLYFCLSFDAYTFEMIINFRARQNCFQFVVSSSSSSPSSCRWLNHVCVCMHFKNHAIEH